MKVLVSAYACEPNRGSEGEIGWGVVLELAKTHDVWVLTRANNVNVHREYFDKLENGQPDTLKFVYYDLPKWASFYKKGKRNFLVYYYHWQLASCFVASEVCKKNKIDIIHHLTGGMDFFPSGLSFLKYPFVFGPIGGEDTHPLIFKNLPIKDKLKEFKRLFQRAVLRHLDPFTRFTYSKANRVIKYSSKNANSSNKYYQRCSEKLSSGKQTGLILDERYKHKLDVFERNDTFTILYAANLIPWKGGRFVVDAFQKFCNHDVKNVKLIVVGSGPLLNDMQTCIQDVNLAEQVEFIPWLPMQELIDLLPKADVFLYPTYHHGLATICLQAMYMGLPMVCLKGDGIETVLENGGGIAVGFDSFDDIGQNLANAISTLYNDEELRVKLAKEAQNIVARDFNYKVLADEIMVVYKQALENCNEQ